MIAGAAYAGLAFLLMLLAGFFLKRSERDADILVMYMGVIVGAAAAFCGWIAFICIVGALDGL